MFKIRYEVYVINLYKYKPIETHWTDFYVNGSFGVEYIPEEIRKSERNKKDWKKIIFKE